MEPVQKIEASEIWFYSALDALMSENQDDGEYFVSLFERKKQIISLMQEGKIDAKKYLTLIKKMYQTSPGLKPYAEKDLLDLKQMQSQLDQWFQAKVNQTGVYFETQEALYSTMKQAPGALSQFQGATGSTAQEENCLEAGQKQQTPAESLKDEIGVSGLNFVELISLKALDMFMGNFYDSSFRETFIQLFEKKKKLLEAIDKSAINSQKYFQLNQKVFDETKNRQLKNCIRVDLDMLADLYENDIEKWFSEVLQDSKSQLFRQEDVYKKHCKGIEVKKSDPDEELNLSGFTEPEETYEPSECLSFAVIDSVMDKAENDPLLFVDLYEKKSKLLGLVEEGALNGQKYCALLKKAIANAKKYFLAYVKIKLKKNLTDINEGNVKQWFESILDATNSNAMLQEDKYQELKPQAEQIRKEMRVQAQERQTGYSGRQQVFAINEGQKLQSNQPQRKLEFEISKMFNIKIIDDSILSEGDVDERFRQLFTQKLRMIEMMKNGGLDSAKYRALQEKMLIQHSSSAEIVDRIRMDLEEIETLYSQNVEEWFQEAVEMSGIQFEDQLARFKKLSPSVQSKTVEVQSPPSGNQVEKIEPPQNSEILCFTAILKGPQAFAQDEEVMALFKAKRTKMLEWVSAEKLNAKKYQLMSHQILTKTTNLWLRKIMQVENQVLESQYEGEAEKWFQALTKQLSEAKQVQVKGKVDSVNLKVDFLLSRMAAYESLCRYFKQNHLSPSKNEAIKSYLTGPRKEIHNNLEKIHSNALNVQQYCQQYLPALTPEIFHGGVENFQLDITKAITCFEQQIEARKEYMKKIRKTINKNNIESANKRIEECLNCIINLKRIAKEPSNMMPAPEVEQEKKELFNMDLYQKLKDNQVEIRISSVSELSEQCDLQIHCSGTLHKEKHVTNGPVEFSAIIEVQKSEMAEILKGSNKYVQLKLRKKNWFSTSKLGQEFLDLQFIRSNHLEEKVQVGGALVSFEAKVRLAKKPIVTEVIQYSLKQYPAYKHSKEVEAQFKKKFNPKD